MQKKTKRIISVEALMSQTDKSRVTIYRWVKQDKLPKPKKINNRNFWYADDIETAIENLMKENVA